MVDVIREKCSITGKVIIGIGLDDFQEKWNKHIESLKQEKKIDKVIISETEEKTINKVIKKAKKEKAVVKKKK